MRALLLTLTICFVAIPAYAKYSGGTGDPNDPYQIATAENLMLLGETPEDYDKHFILTADIDLDPNLPGRKVFDKAVIAPDANDTEDGFQGTPFTGVFDGNGHTISHLTIDGGDYLGLFGLIDLGSGIYGGEVRDLGIADVNIIGTGGHIGGLVGANGDYSQGGLVINCYSTGSISGHSSVSGLVGANWGSITASYSTSAVSGVSHVGGLVGYNWRLGDVTDCYATGWVNSSGSYIGGLVGYNMGYVIHCKSSGPVNGDGDVGGLVGGNLGSIFNSSSWSAVSGNSHVGGLVGNNSDFMKWWNPSLSQCYSTGSVNGNSYVGGLVGYNSFGRITHCYSTGLVTGMFNIGGLVGDNGDGYYVSFGVVIHSFWDTETSNCTTSNGGMGKTTAEMQDIRTYRDAGWDFWGEREDGLHEIWLMPEEGGYPLLAIFNGYTPPELQGMGTVEDPYLISNALELGAIVHYGSYAHYRLTDSIDLSGLCWGTSVIPQFAGTFDGNGYTISHLTINGWDYLGLFGQLKTGAEVMDLGVMDVNIIGTGDYVGGLAGSNEGAVIECYSTGSVTGGDNVGGVVGCNDGEITNSYSNDMVSGDGSVGGFVGSNGGSINASYSMGKVTGTERVGGLVGFSDGIITTSYSNVSVNGNSNVGGLVGYGDPLGVIHSVWDTEISGQSSSFGGVGLNTAEITDPYMLGLNGFANDPNWVLDVGRDYPRLAWEETPGNIIPEPIIDWLEGNGTKDAPYRIDTADQLILIGRTSALWDKHFVLVADIDLDPNLPDGEIFAQAVIQTFRGVFDGKGHKIYNLTIIGGSYLGLFGQLGSTAIVSNLGLKAVEITGTGSVGGLVGSNSGGYLCQCSITGVVTGTGQSGNVGGLVGYNEGTVSQCYSTVSVKGSYSYSGHAGGLVGANWGDVTQCYSIGTVSGRDYVGGLVGYGKNYSTVTASFWDTQTSGRIQSTWGKGKTTAEMQTARTFLNAGWDLVDETANGTEDIWWINEGQDYPRLWWEVSDL